MSADSSQPHPQDQLNQNPHLPDVTPVTVKFDVKMLAVVTLIIVFIREVSVWLMTQMGYENLGNFLGLFVLFGFAIVYRISQGEIPSRMVAANSKILKEGIFAFLPICAGIGTLLAGLGGDAFKILLIMVLSTLIPLRIYAYMVEKWR
jgi:putative effector of murein hydrolase LrgA (UPF0299 family)